jgi:hypothetical protein
MFFPLGECGVAAVAFERLVDQLLERALGLELIFVRAVADDPHEDLHALLLREPGLHDRGGERIDAHEGEQVFEPGDRRGRNHRRCGLDRFGAVNLLRGRLLLGNKLGSLGGHRLRALGGDLLEQLTDRLRDGSRRGLCWRFGATCHRKHDSTIDRSESEPALELGLERIEQADATKEVRCRVQLGEREVFGPRIKLLGGVPVLPAEDQRVGTPGEANVVHCQWVTRVWRAHGPDRTEPIRGPDWKP